MSALVAAVGTDTYGGLSGFKRPTSGNPTRVPSNLPAFRGVTNTPGSNIKAPAVKSSANHPDRKTNVQIPYARVVPVEFPASLGRLAPGDVAFVSKSRPGLPGYACAYQSRLIGVDALNRFMGPDYWNTMIEVGNTYRYLLIDSKMPADDWRSVPSLQEWTLDGVVLSNEEREIFYNASDGKRENQLYNIAIQGPTIVNNGYVEEHQGWDEVARVEQGQIARQQETFSGSYMDHRVEKFGPYGEMEVDQSWDFAANYQGPQYHLYPMQMFDRSIRPLNKLYVGLVCAEYRFDKKAIGLISQAALAQANIAAAQKEVSKVVAAVRKAELQLAAASQNVEAYDAAEAALTAAKAEETRASALPRGPEGDRARADAGAAVANAQSTVSQLGSKAALILAYNTASAAVKAMHTDLGGAETEVRNLKEYLDQLIAKHDDLPEAVRAKTAWAKMGWWGAEGPKAEGTDRAPKESFCAFRYVLFTSAQLDEINLKSTGNPGGVDVQVVHPNEPVLRTKRQKLGKDPYSDDNQRKKDFQRMVGAWHIGSVLDMKAGKMPWFDGGPADTGFRVTTNVNVHWCDWRQLRREYTPAGSAVQVAEALTGSPKWSKDEVEFEQNRVLFWPTRVDAKDPEKNKPRSTGGNRGDPDLFGDAEKAAVDLARREEEPIESAIRAGRLARLAVVPPSSAGDNLHHSVHIERAGTALKNLALLLAPITAEEIAAHRGNTALPPVARYVMANPPAPAPVATEASRTPEPPRSVPRAEPAAAAPTVPTPTAAPSSVLAPEAPAADAPAADAVAPMVIEAPAAPATTAATAAGRKRRPGATDDVFSTIFGGSSTDAPMQPLNPQHRSDAGAGSSGRSYQRRSKGSGSGGKS